MCAAVSSVSEQATPEWLHTEELPGFADAALPEIEAPADAADQAVAQLEAELADFLIVEE